jgi:hypothetical protein
MNHRTWPVLLLAAGCFLGAGRPAGAQPLPQAPAGGETPSPSHKPISDGNLDPQSAELALANRLRRLKGGHEPDALKKLVEDLLKDEELKKKLSDPRYLEELQKKYRTNPNELSNDPRYKDLLDKIRENPEFKKEVGKGAPSPELLEDLKKKMLEKLAPGTGSTPPPPEKQGDPPPRVPPPNESSQARTL